MGGLHRSRRVVGDASRFHPLAKNFVQNPPDLEIYVKANFIQRGKRSDRKAALRQRMINSVN